MKDMRYNHAISLNFEIDSNNELPTSEEMLKSINYVVSTLTKDNVAIHIEVFDTTDRQEEE